MSKIATSKKSSSQSTPSDPTANPDHSTSTSHSKSSPIFTVTKFEIIRQIKKPSFWIALLLTPLLVSGLALLNTSNSQNLNASLQSTDFSDIQAIGIVDHPGLFQGKLNTPTNPNPNPNSNPNSISYENFLRQLRSDLPQTPPQNPAPQNPSTQNPSTQNLSSQNSPAIQFFPDESAALTALTQNTIQIFYLIPADLAQNPTARIIARRIATTKSLFSTSERNLITNLIQSVAIKDLTPTHLALITGNFTFESISLDQTTHQPTNLLGKALIPILIGVIFYFMIIIFGNRLPMVVVEEKENRISEMILTAVSARHLIIGKILSAVVLALLQIICLITPVIAIIILNRHTPFIASLLSAVELDPLTIITNILLLFASYFFFAGLCILVGTLTSTAREASQYSGIIAFAIILPLFFLNLLVDAKQSTAPLTILLSYFPLTAPLSLMLRNAFGTIPLTPLLLGVLALSLYSALVIALAITTFQKHALTFTLVKPSLPPPRLWRPPTQTP